MKKILAGLSCLISGLLPLLVIIILSLITKDYLLFRDFISVLGVKEFAAYFNWALVITGFLIIPFALHMHRIIKQIYIIPLFALVIVSLICIGLFPMNVEIFHTLASSAFFFSVFVLILAIGLKTKLGLFSKTALIIGALGLVFDGVHVVLDFNPTIEAIQVFMITLWLVYAGIDILKGVIKN